jgi:hypothetical protein
MENVTPQIIADIRSLSVRTYLRDLKPASGITPAGRKLLQLIHDMPLAFVSNPLVYDDAWRGWPKPRHKTLVRLLLGGFVQVYRVNGPLPGVHPTSRIGARSPSHYLLRAPSLVETSEQAPP